MFIRRSNIGNGKVRGSVWFVSGFIWYIESCVADAIWFWVLVKSRRVRQWTCTLFYLMTTNTKCSWMVIWFNWVFVICEIAKLCIDSFWGSWKGLRLHSIVEFNLILNFTLVRVMCEHVIRAYVKLGSSFALTVFLINCSGTQVIVLWFTSIKNIISAVECLSFIKGYLFKYIVLACLTFFLLH